MSEIIVETFETQFNAIPEKNREAAKEYWQDRSAAQVLDEMPALQRWGHTDIAVVEPTSDVDETETFVLPLEFTQGFTPAHYMRAKEMQNQLNPSARVVVMPNTTLGLQHVNFTDAFTKENRGLMKAGNYMPYGEMLMDSLERADKIHNFGELMIHGSSQGGLSALALPAVGSARIRIGGVSAVETPSAHRGPVKTALDFMTSGGDLAKAVKGSEIPAQLEVMSGLALIKDLGKFALYAPTAASNRLLVRAMSGSANGLIELAREQIGDEAPITLQYVEGSKMFDPASLAPAVARAVEIIRLEGPETTKHATPNNLRFNAAMAYRGLQLSSRA